MSTTDKVRTGLLITLGLSTLLTCALAGFIGAAIGRERRDRGFFEAGWAGGKKWQEQQPCKQEVR